MEKITSHCLKRFSCWPVKNNGYICGQINPVMEVPLDHDVPVQQNEGFPLTQINLNESVEAVRKAAYWFFGIAILSIINSFLASKGTYFVLGLGASQVLDGIAMELTGEVNFFLSLIPPAFMAMIGFFAARCNRWAFIVGAIVYFLDAILFLLFSEWLAFGFHLFVLYKLWQGFKTISEYDELKLKLAREGGL